MTLTPNMSIYVPINGQQLFSAAFLAGMQNIDDHGHTGAPNDGVPIGTNGIQDGAITPAKLSFTLFDEASIETTDATPTNIATVSVLDSHAVTIRGIFVAITTNTIESIGGDFAGTFYRQSGGSVQLVGSSTVNINSNFAGAATFSLNANAVSNEVELICTGEAGKDIVWTAQFNYIDRDTTL